MKINNNSFYMARFKGTEHFPAWEHFRPCDSTSMGTGGLLRVIHTVMDNNRIKTGRVYPAERYEIEREMTHNEVVAFLQAEKTVYQERADAIARFTEAYDKAHNIKKRNF